LTAAAPSKPRRRGTAAAARVDLLVLDVDGVLTDGSIYLDDLGREIKRFHVRDGFGIKLWCRLGFRVAIITGRRGRALTHRARELGITHLIQGAEAKWPALQRLLAKMHLSPDRVACIADDWPELPVMRRIGFPIAVADADARVRAAAAWVTRRPGGHGAVREAIDHLIHAKGLMPEAVRRYDGAHDER